MSVSAVLGIGSLISSLLGAFGVGGTDGSSTQVNPLTDQYYRDILGQLSQATAGQTGAFQRQQEASRGMGQQEADMARIQGQMEGAPRPEANEWFRQFLGNVPGLEQVALNFAEQSTQDLGRNLNEQARVNQGQAMSDVAGQFAGQGAFSGAAAGAMGQAAAQPLAQAQTQLLGQRSQMAGNTFNQLAGQNQELAYQDQQAQFQNLMAQLGQALGASSTRAGTFQGQGALANQEAGIFGQTLGQLRQQQADVAQPVYQQQQGTNPLGALGQLLSAGAGLYDQFGPNTSLNLGVPENSPRGADYTGPKTEYDPFAWLG